MGRRQADGAVLFDLDGVLVDSRVPFARCVNAALERHSLPARPEAELHRFLGPPLHATFEALGAGEQTQSCVDAYRERYRECAAQETPVFDGVPEMLSSLRVPLGVATSKPRALAEPLLEALGLRDRFAVVAGPSLDAEGEGKGVTLGRALAFLPAAAMVGDRRYDMAAAREHGLRAVGVLWGIGDEQELLEAGAHALARTPAELSAALSVE
jgi:phosphoglycolate phosphatase